MRLDEIVEPHVFFLRPADLSSEMLRIPHPEVLGHGMAAKKLARVDSGIPGLLDAITGGHISSG
jgi:hypothetical protein